MPIALFQQIINQSCSGRKLPGSGQHTGSFITDYYIIPADQFPQNGLALIDGIPTIAIFTDMRGTITVSQANKTYTVPSAWLSSQYLENTHFQTVSYNSDLLILRFDPVSFYQRFSIDPASLREKPVWSLPDALGLEGEGLLAHVSGAPSISEKLKAVALFTKAFDKPIMPNPLVTDAFSFVDACNGQTSVKSILEKLRVNYKWLERNFNRHLGISPKEYIRLQRFKHAYLDFLDRCQHCSLVEIAITNGYYDAAHFVKDIARFTGKGYR